MIKKLHKRTYTACHYVNNWMLDVVFLDMLTTFLQGDNIIINRLCGTNLWHINLKTMGIMKFEFMIINFFDTIKLGFIHASITISLTCNMILNVFIILVILGKLIHESFITAISPQRF
ncbi:hypothetical protein FC25_GL001511 [Ligilactobacillus ruminis DSM 20403 = NBRC 102161]|nr:hypothetical protein FC25_GL001511 [Ligilactobacillus ruminis DSM 20403 = NBRC 102161]